VVNSPGPFVPGGWLLVAFHIDSPEFAVGEVNHLTSWFGEPVELDGFFLEPAEVAGHVEAAGFTVISTLVRSPWPDTEYPSRRCSYSHIDADRRPNARRGASKRIVMPLRG
jgi:hypothetical protein